MRRILSVWLPNLPLERLRRMEPGAVPDELPFGLVTSQGGRLVISAVTAAALSAGVSPGMRLADARAVCPALVTQPSEPAHDTAALRRLARWCLRYGPAFNTDGADGLWVDTTGVAHLFGGEAGLLADLGRHLAVLGLTARFGLADGLGAASALARFALRPAPAGPGACIAPPGTARTALLALPAEALRLDLTTVRLLRRLGLKTIGQLCNLPRATLKRRFPSRETAEAVLLRLDQALGLKPEPLRPLKAPSGHAVRAVFPEPIIASDGLETALATLAADLCAGLARASRGARRLTLTLYRSDGTRTGARIGLNRPSRSPEHMLRLFREKLGGVDARFGIDLMLLAAGTSEPLSPVQDALATVGPDDSATNGDGMSALIDSLAGRLGPECVLRLKPCASQLPEHAECRVSAMAGPHAHEPPRAAGLPQPGSAGYARPPLLLPSPEPVTVVAEVPEGPPLTLRWRRTLRRVVRAEGPERIAPEWWRETGGMASGPRDYYVIEDEMGARFWVFRDGLYGSTEKTGNRTPSWYLQGLFA